jgi:amidase
MLLSTQAGRHPGAPLSIAQDGAAFAAPLETQLKGQRVGWLGDLKGYLPMDPGVLDTCELALKSFESMGCPIESTGLGMDPAEVWDTWLVWRKALIGPRIAPHMARTENHAQVKPEARWEYEQSLQLTGPQLLAASAGRTRFYQHMRALFERFDVLAMPSAQVWPFDLNMRWPTEIHGRSMDTYHRWMEVVIYSTLAGLPSISVPAGFAPEGPCKGLPMGLQLIGKPQGDFELLLWAFAYEQANLSMIQQRPPGV